MARFDDELTRRLKEKTDIVRPIESYGTRGRNGAWHELLKIAR